MTQSTLTTNQTSNVLLVEGATPIVDAIIEKLKTTFNPPKFSLIKCEQPGGLCKVKVFFNYFLGTTSIVMTHILTSIGSTLASDLTDVTGKNVVVRYEHYTFTFTPDVVAAIRQQAEITYVVTCKVVKHLKPKNIVRAENLVEYFHDTCCTYFEGKTFVTDKYYFPSLKQPLPVEEMVEVCTGTEYILKQFSQVKELNCTVRATGVAHN